MMRSVRDERYRYVRNYYPERPYVQWIPYRNRHPAMEELLERDANGELTDTQAQWFADTRPAEELYDLQEDPHEIENLADDPTHEDVLERLRGALDDWRQRTGDRAAGREAELDMRERVWPDGDQPTTATPTFVPNAPGNRGLEPDNDGGTFEGPMTVKLFCPTQGPRSPTRPTTARIPTGSCTAVRYIWTGVRESDSGPRPSGTATLRATSARRSSRWSDSVVGALSRRVVQVVFS
ncbi:hypothetical protein ACFQL7_26155 [Halocatena marina]|uniref:N-sulphoglucosamine sulphohydrolase C-terminal domain-containing protein n=1 Tax=Halocatena marina TaxID=2934937 RepID=A0ABD5YXY2_9EURY